MAALSVAEALDRILIGVVPVETEFVGLLEAGGRILAAPLAAMRTHPPFDASAMDGYAVRAADVVRLPATLTLIGQSAAGRPFVGSVAPGQAVRIFTGAPLPDGADAIVIQENATSDGSLVTVVDGRPDADHIRPMGGDFTAGQCLLAPGIRLTARHVLLAAGMGHARVPVHRKPVVAIMSTGDELVPPGEHLAAGQITASNAYAIAALATAAGAEPRYLGIARDTVSDLCAHITAAAGADILVTIGGASVGDHDLVASAFQQTGFDLDFWKIAMRPGKPLIHARNGRLAALGLPGNPVSSLICARVFLVPLIARLSGATGLDDHAIRAQLTEPLGANGPRQHYMRAALDHTLDGQARVTPARSQDSSLSALLAASNALIVRPPNAPPAAAGENVSVLAIDF
ncbi:MAG: molybdopterin molybdotransferase MoeA [Hyphomicrobiaceae bacterium]|nr:molybdopterin molybdotransferase MoeA [Hyphomicrobiaceae bacterium]